MGNSNTIERLDAFEANFQSTPIGLVLTDLDGAILDANPAFLNLYGYKHSEVLGNNPRVIKSGRQPPRVYEEMWADILDPEKGSWAGEIFNRKKTGEDVYVLLSITSLRDENGHPRGFIASTVDISSQRALETDLRVRNDELKKLSRLKSDFISITSHDLKSPLGSIINYVDLLRINLGDGVDEKTSRYLNRINEAASGLTNLVKDLLDLGKIEAGRMTLDTRRVRLDEVITRCVNLAEATAWREGVKLSLSLETIPRPVIADVIKIEQVINNLLSNAINYTPEGGNVIVRYASAGKDKVRIVIEDDGTGIPESELEAVFDPYRRASNQRNMPERLFGAGLGLSIVRQVVELHRGRVWAQNKVEGGCRFTVEIPWRFAVNGPRDMAAILYDPAGRLFADFEAPLSSLGFTTLIAKDIEELKGQYRHEEPDILLIDMGGCSPEMKRLLQSMKSTVMDRALFVGVSSEPTPGGGETFDLVVGPPESESDVQALAMVRMSKHFK